MVVGVWGFGILVSGPVICPYPGPPYKGTSLMRKRQPPRNSICPYASATVGSYGGGRFLMSEVLLYQKSTCADLGFGFRRFQVSGFRSKVSGFRAQVSGFEVSSLGVRVWVLGFTRAWRTSRVVKRQSLSQIEKFPYFQRPLKTCIYMFLTYIYLYASRINQIPFIEKDSNVSKKSPSLKRPVPYKPNSLS